MSGLTGLLEALVAKHDAIGSPIRHYLRPPLGTDDVTLHLRGLDLDPTADLLDLYAWHDGIDQEAWQRDGGRGNLSVFSRADFPSLDRAARGCAQYRDVAAEIASHPWTRANRRTSGVRIGFQSSWAIRRSMRWRAELTIGMRFGGSSGIRT